MSEVGRSLGWSALCFGPFQLVVTERLLERDGRPIPLGGRGLALLIALVARPNQLISKKELIRQAWPDVTVDEGSLRFHIAMLRRALGDGVAGAKYIDTLPGRGYRFVAPVSAVGGPFPATGGTRASLHRLPAHLARMVGRNDALSAVEMQLMRERFVTIVGHGGMGKTTLAVAVGHALLGTFEGSVRFVDLGPVADPALVPAAIAAVIGLVVETPDPIGSIAAFLRERQMLLILDSCEHVVEAVAILADRVHAAAPLVRILATSREALRAQGEHVHHLAPLQSPPERASVSAAEALQYPAVELFVERVAAGDADFVLSNADAPIVATICRRLDGVPLAIELAAGRVAAYGVRDTARLLESRFHLLWPGRRTAAPRHQTLAAALDWSHDLLAERERVVLRRLAAFAGFFDLDAAQVIGAGGELDGGRVLDALAGLIAKSLVSVDRSGAINRFRLLDTTRAYAAGKLAASSESTEIAARHASYYCDLLSALNAGAPDPSQGEALALYGDHVSNVSAALEWCFGRDGDHEQGVALAAAAGPLFLRLSLLTEYRSWMEQAIAALDDASRGTRRELELQVALVQCLMFTRGNDGQVRTVCERGLEIAERIGSAERQIEFLGWLHVSRLRTGNHLLAFAYAQRSHAAAAQLGSQRAVAAAHCSLAISCHWLGRYAEAETHFVAALEVPRGPSQPGFDYRTYAHIGFARTLWICGRADRAAASVSRATEEVVEFGQPLMRCMIFLFNATVYLWRGDLTSAEAMIDPAVELADRHSMGSYRAVGLGMKGELAVRRGMIEEGVKALTDALTWLDRDRYTLMTTGFTLTAAEGLRALGRYEDGLAMIEASTQRAERDSELLAMPEMLRLRGELLANAPGTMAREAEAEAALARALELANSTGALGWELRAAMSLARFWSSRRRAREAEALLASVHGRFTEGFDTVDLLEAGRLLGTLRHAADASGSARNKRSNPREQHRAR